MEFSKLNNKSDIEKELVAGFDKNFSYPGSLYIQPTNQCNLRCKMCAVYGRPDYKEEKAEFMDFSLYKKVINEVKDKKITIAPTGGGEAFLHPQIFDMIKYAKDQGVETVFIDTNAVLLDEKMIDRLIETGIDVISVSIDAFSPSSYGEVRRNPNYDKVVNNVKYMIKRKGKNNKPQIYTSFVCQNVNRNEKNDFIKYWLSTADQVIINNKHNQHNGMVEDLNYMPPMHICGYPYLAMHILVDGSVSPCSHYSLDGKHVFGNVKDNPVFEIWNGKLYKEFRKKLIDNLLNENKQCGSCNQWMSFGHKIIKNGPIIVNETPTTRVYSLSDKSFKNKLILKFSKL